MHPHGGVSGGRPDFATHKGVGEKIGPPVRIAYGSLREVWLFGGWIMFQSVVEGPEPEESIYDCRGDRVAQA